LGQLILPERGVVCLDADAIIYMIEKIHPYDSLLLPLLKATKAGRIQLAGSELLLIETLVKPVEQANKALESDFRKFMTASRDMHLVPITRAVLEHALSLRALHHIRSADAIHAATALIMNCAIFITNDPVFRRIPQLSVAVLDDSV
jgi:predicted nucleic acid-binding protein